MLNMLSDSHVDITTCCVIIHLVSVWCGAAASHFYLQTLTLENGCTDGCRHSPGLCISHMKNAARDSPGQIRSQQQENLMTYKFCSGNQHRHLPLSPTTLKSRPFKFSISSVFSSIFCCCLSSLHIVAFFSHALTRTFPGVFTRWLAGETASIKTKHLRPVIPPDDFRLY